MGPEGSENKEGGMLQGDKEILMSAIYHIVCKTFLIVQTVVGQIH